VTFRPPFPVRARGRSVRREAGVMNKTEAAYAAYLEGQKLLGGVLEFWFDSIKLRLADNCFYTPDFLVLLIDGTLEVHEVKGYWEDDARVKIKVAAEKFPYVFRAVTARTKKDGGGWNVETFA
jgi:hypothetical protein